MLSKSPKQLLIYSVIAVLVIAAGVEIFTDISIRSYVASIGSESEVEPEEVQEEEERDIGWIDGAPCEGKAIEVDYEWPHPTDEDFENPWECEVQCEGGRQRYISYSNGIGTQCEKIPDCFDIGEDYKVTCSL